MIFYAGLASIIEADEVAGRRHISKFLIGDAVFEAADAAVPLAGRALVYASGWRRRGVPKITRRQKPEGAMTSYAASRKT